MAELSMMVPGNTEGGQTAASVVLGDDGKRTLRALFATLDTLGILRVMVESTDEGHRCNCEFCHLDGPDFTVDAVRIVYDTGKRETYCNAAAAGHHSFQHMLFDLDCLTDVIWEFYHDDIIDCQFGWTEFDATRRMVDGGRIIELGTYWKRVHDWTCDIRHADDANRLWD